MTNPDFIIIGAMKCGTSTLAAQLGAQSGVFMAVPKEPNYFSDDEIFARGPNWYGSLFESAQPNDITGEASTHYTKTPIHPQTVERIVDSGVTPQLIYMIRNPFERMVSHYIHERTMGIIQTDFDTAVTEHPELIAYSQYGRQLTPWIEAFGAKRVLVLTMEQMKKAPDDTLSRAASHIGLHRAQWVSELNQLNASAERVRRYPLHNIVFDNDVARGLRRTLVPKKLRTFIKTKRQIHDRPEFSTTTRRHLNDVFFKDRAVLESILPAPLDLNDVYGEMTS